MAGFQDAKALVRAHHAALAGAAPDTVADILAERTGAGWHWRGVHPFNEQHGAQAVAESFWAPFLTAMSRVQRREDIFFAGDNEQDGGPRATWVVSMGHLMALFDRPFVGIPPTRKIAMLRYAEFNRVEGGKIVETAFFCDLIHLMHQAGLRPLPPQTAAHLVQPGPLTHDGLLRDDADPAEGAETLALIERMIHRIGAAGRVVDPRGELPQDWHDDMIWWGPDGIGATYTIDRYAEQHQAPFRNHNKDRTFNGHIARLAEGSYGGFFGWPNLSLTPLGGYMGLPAGPRADMRVVDIYRRDGDKLAENWVFIDMLHFLRMQGLDLLERQKALVPPAPGAMLG
ncbi:ester cyclase [Oceaniglobus trochenteri]|uniref:ester cyclase n=1 Tax=Oceaniglobus trochenteri TaxID=2763260 RepID=UPI001CFF93DB|nr:ester cyclase [Oceaniglobus trochenteri]